MSISSQLIGRTIKSGVSSLTRFSCELDNGTALVLEAADKSQPTLRAQVVDSSTMSKEADAVCKVDWGWICDSKIEHVDLSSICARLRLDKAGTVTISVQVWQGKPFLAFQPYRPA